MPVASPSDCSSNIKQQANTCMGCWWPPRQTYLTHFWSDSEKCLSKIFSIGECTEDGHHTVRYETDNKGVCSNQWVIVTETCHVWTGTRARPVAHRDKKIRGRRHWSVLSSSRSPSLSPAAALSLPSNPPKGLESDVCHFKSDFALSLFCGFLHSSSYRNRITT